MQKFTKEGSLEGTYSIINSDELFGVALLKRDDGFYVIAHNPCVYGESVNWARCQTLGNIEDAKAFKFYKQYIVFENLDGINIGDVITDHVLVSNHCLNKAHIMYMYRRLWDELDQVYKHFVHDIGDATFSAYCAQSTYRGELLNKEKSLEYFMDAAAELINSKKISVGDYLVLKPLDIIRAIEVEFGE